MSYPLQLICTCAIGIVIWYALERLGLRPWVAWLVMWALIMGVAAVVQFGFQT